jgi:hypothetical protein
MKADEAGRAGDEHRALFQAFNGVFAGHPVRPRSTPARGRFVCYLAQDCCGALYDEQSVC